MTKLAYLRRSLAAQFKADRFRCPNCGGTHNSVVDRKYLVTQLRRCENCKMMFRTPTDDPAGNQSFYENDYTQGFTTELPSDSALTELKRSNFVGTEKCYSYYISVLTQLGLEQGARVFDYGCSWGYGSYQLAQAGFEVTSFEVAPSRRRYAHGKLGVSTVNDMDRVAADLAFHFDCFFSAHVLEHVPSPAQSLNYAMQLLKPGGLFVSFTPNGSEGNRAVEPNWSQHWGEVHPNFIDDTFLDSCFKFSPRAVGSSPVTDVSLPERPELKRLDKIDHGELFFAARKTGNTWG
jgi:2-polyprenyl-3-methyl-5-hydroxy-6-metoxy-1,4-benzoquinol methylase